MKTHRATSFVSATLLLIMCACAPEPLVFQDWTIEVPEGTPVHEYPFVEMAERTDRLVFERDLVIRQGFGRGLYRPSAVAVAADGTLFVLDNGNYRVLAFDLDGNALREFGRQGQGPGEFQSPVGFGVAGDHVLVSDIRNNRLSTFTTDGELIADRQLDDSFWAESITAVDDELLTIVAAPQAIGRVDAPYEVPWILARYSGNGEKRAVVAERSASVKALFNATEIVGRMNVVYANPIGAFGPAGVAYVTSGDAYQVLAFAPSGAPSWALRTTFTAQRLTEEQKQATLARLRDDLPFPDAEAMLAGARFLWPERYAAIENLEVDGRGNLFVFPYLYRPPDVEPGPDSPVPVDVYASDGTVLFTGLSPINEWDAAFGDLIFRLEDDPDTGERVLGRYRIGSFD